MDRKQDWELVFECPGCRRAGRVAVSAMHSILRCPNCRKKVVIGKQAIRTAPNLLAYSRLPAFEKKIAPAPCIPPRIAATAACLVGVAVIVAAVLASRLPVAFRAPSGKLEVHTEGLPEAAESFQMAWLEGDLEAAEKFVLEADRVRLNPWAAPRRAALVAGFGERFQARVTAVEVIRTVPQKAEVRVRFVVRGREQQTYQDWVPVGTSWKIALDPPADDGA